MAKDAEVDPATEPPVTIQRMPDGRHAVLSPSGAILGQHKSPFSAARQVHDYFGPVASPSAAAAAQPTQPPAEKVVPGTPLAKKFKHDKVPFPKIPHKKIPKPPKDHPVRPHV